MQELVSVRAFAKTVNKPLSFIYNAIKRAELKAIRGSDKLLIPVSEADFILGKKGVRTREALRALTEQYAREGRNKDGIPILPARVSLSGIHYVVWCSFCRREHYHGTCGEPDNRELQHRCTDCGSSESPYDRTGYFIEPIIETDIC